MITLTEAAAKHIRDSILKRGKGIGIRVGIKSTGCSGFSHILEYADGLNIDDYEFDHGQIKILVSSAHIPYVDGTQIDYVKKGLNEGFEFNNPCSKGECGCGKSFKVA
jgi:iron-sulfur cluster assembly protein